MDDRQFRLLLEYLERPWRGYRNVRKGVKKRIHKHMQQLGCRNLETYLHILDTNKAVRQECEQLMCVSISRFFRDRRLWESLQDRVLPSLLEAGTGPVRAWSAGCACGEEVYSLEILWDRLVRNRPDRPRLDITATDMNPGYLRRAVAGIYPASSLREVPEGVKEEYFTAKPEGRIFEVRPSLRVDIRWECMDVRLAASGDPSFRLILLRNGLLTYYKEAQWRTVLEAILKRLAPGGYLAIGSHERIPARRLDLRPDSSLPYLYRKAH